MEDAHTFQGLGVNVVCDAQSGVVVLNSSPEAQLWGMLQELLQCWALSLRV